MALRLYTLSRWRHQNTFITVRKSVLICCCHDDSTRRHPPISVARKRILRSQFPSGIPASRQKIILELNKVIQGKTANVEARHSIQSRLETLESVGCLLDDVQAKPDVLLLSEKQVIDRVLKLKSLKQRINVQSLTSVGNISTTKTHASKFKSKDHVEVCEILHCTASELETLEQLHFKTVSHVENVFEKINYLLSQGLSVDEIKHNFFILKRKLESLRDLLESIRIVQGGELDEKSIQLFLECEHSSQRGRHLVSVRHKVLADFFKVDRSYISDLRYANVRFETVLRKLVFLMKLGMDRNDIFNHFYLVRHSFEKLEQGAAVAAAAGISKMTAVTLVNIIQHKTVPPRKGKSRSRAFIATLLDISSTDVRSLGEHVNPVFATDKVVLQANTKYLMKKGFSKEDIKQCLLILCHDPDVLVEYVEHLPDNEQFQACQELMTDKNFILNAVQYLIERNSNFNCKENLRRSELCLITDDKDD